jgi:hypothetical protein
MIATAVVKVASFFVAGAPITGIESKAKVNRRTGITNIFFFILFHLPLMIIIGNAIPIIEN